LVDRDFGYRRAAPDVHAITWGYIMARIARILRRTEGFTIIGFAGVVAALSGLLLVAVK
jgi:hypothetical protein